MTSDWDFYPLLVDNQPASIFVDLGIAKQAPLSNYPTMGYVRIRMKHPRNDSLSSSEEFNELCQLEDHVVQHAEEDGNAIFVGRNTSSGNRDLYFYAHEEASFKNSIPAAMKRFGAYAFEVGCRTDAKWQTYFEFLHPSRMGMQRILNRRVNDQLKTHGDNPNNERLIDHMAMFPGKEGVLALAEHLRSLRFTIDEMADEPADDGLFDIRFSRVDRPVEIDDLVLPLFKTITELGGEYDGWGCSISPDA